MSVDKVRIQLEPSGVTMEVPSGTSLASVLSQHGVDFSCGGTSLCGSCRIRVLDGSLPVTEEDGAVFSVAELVSGWRLACQAHARMPLVLQCGQWQMDILTDNSTLSGMGKKGLGIAIDLGTTTIAAQMIDMTTGSVLGVQTELNPQMMCLGCYEPSPGGTIRRRFDRGRTQHPAADDSETRRWS